MLTRLTTAAALATTLLLLTGGTAGAHVSPNHGFTAGHSGNVVDLLTAIGVTGCAAVVYWRWRRRML